MRLHEIEAWVLSIVDRVAKGQPVEDTRVELKAKWPDPEWAALPFGPQDPMTATVRKSTEAETDPWTPEQRWPQKVIGT